MKRYIYIVFVIFTLSAKCFAERNGNHINMGVGALYERGFDATLSMEHETKYHNAWEYFINGYIQWDKCESCGHVCPDCFWRNYRTWNFGVAYKPCVSRGRNQHGNLRIGTSAGSNTNKFLGGIHIGYEHNYALKKGWTFYWQAKCDLMLPDRNDLFRTGIVLGIKIPTVKH